MEIIHLIEHNIALDKVLLVVSYVFFSERKLTHSRIHVYPFPPRRDRYVHVKSTDLFRGWMTGVEKIVRYFLSINTRIRVHLPIFS